MALNFMSMGPLLLETFKSIEAAFRNDAESRSSSRDSDKLNLKFVSAGRYRRSKAERIMRRVEREGQFAKRQDPSAGSASSGSGREATGLRTETHSGASS